MTGGGNGIIHSRAGRLGAAGLSSLADVERILGEAHKANPARGLAIHFHGGLVSAAAGRKIAERLTPIYVTAGAYPLFFVWESGLLENIWNNLDDILKDEVFRELVKKAGEWVLKELGSGITTRGRGATINAHALRADFDKWFDGQAGTPPVSLASPPRDQITTRATEPDEDELATRIEAELDDDERFQEVMAGLYVASGRGTQATTKGGAPAAAEVRALVDKKALDEMFPPQAPGTTKSILGWYKIAKFVAKVVIAVIKRHWNGRDHGAYLTIVEEVLRAAYLDRVGEMVWRMMKKDTADAFGAEKDCVGRAVINCLVRLAKERKTFSRVCLIGHSTGAIYINHFLGHAAAALPDLKFDIIFLAPANRFEDFDKVLAKHPSSIANFRMFAMTDELEAQDQLLSIIYPRSLLYFLSGVLEGEADVPIMGMQRFLVGKEVFVEPEFAAVQRARTWLAQSDRAVWSISTRGDGLNSKSRKHGDFDDDEPTVQSVVRLLKQGF
jgi:hypothetical protein